MTNLRKLTAEQRATLEDFAWLKISAGELAEAVRDVLHINYAKGDLEVRSGIDPFDKIPFTWMHVENALALKRSGKVTSEELSAWARLILALGPPYDLERERQEELAEWLWMLGNDIPATEGA